MGIYPNLLKINAKQIQTLEETFRKGRLYNLFMLVACQKGICFKNSDIEMHGQEMIDAMYMEGMLIWN